MDIVNEGMCYVLLKTGSVHPITKFRHDLLWYPETGMSLVQIIKYKRYVQSIITENPWLISCYSKGNVRVWDSEYLEWRMPYIQTYGASIDVIMSSILDIHQTIPSAVLDGGAEINRTLGSIKYFE